MSSVLVQKYASTQAWDPRVSLEWQEVWLPRRSPLSQFCTICRDLSAGSEVRTFEMSLSSSVLEEAQPIASVTDLQCRAVAPWSTGLDTGHDSELPRVGAREVSLRQEGQLCGRAWAKE